MRYLECAPNQQPSLVRHRPRPQLALLQPVSALRAGAVFHAVILTTIPKRGQSAPLGRYDTVPAAAGPYTREEDSLA